jgi:pullulanase
MASKFIVESLVHWAKNYKIKGFRFDLMGLIDIDTMRAAKVALHEVDPDIVLYGEGWGGYGATTLPGEKMTNSYNLYKYLHNENEPGLVGGFNDTGRNALRGGNDFGGGNFWGFIAQGGNDLANNSNKANVEGMLRGQNGSNGANPLQTVNYTSCHDNFTLFDQLNYTLSDDGGITPPNEETVVQASVAANGLILMSNGIAFINGAEEIFRTKIEDAEEPTEGEVMMYGKRISHNSYMSSDFTNAYKYLKSRLFVSDMATAASASVPYVPESGT